jgi:hypothetical protein
MLRSLRLRGPDSAYTLHIGQNACRLRNSSSSRRPVRNARSPQLHAVHSNSQLPFWMHSFLTPLDALLCTLECPASTIDHRLLMWLKGLSHFARLRLTEASAVVSKLPELSGSAFRRAASSDDSYATWPTAPLTALSTDREMCRLKMPKRGRNVTSMSELIIVRHTRSSDETK